jgi:hypothetical protein
MGNWVHAIGDDEDNQQILRDLLGRAGYEMIEAVAGEAGVAAAISERPDQARFVEGADEHVTTVPGTTIRSASAPQLAVGLDLYGATTSASESLIFVRDA